MVSTLSISTNGRAGAPLPTRQKRPGLAALAIVLMVGLAALGAYFYTKAGQKTPVVEVVKHVPVGHVITRDDLSTLDVAGGVTAIAGSHLDSVVGKVAAVELLPNTLLQRAMVSDSSPFPAGSAMVGVELKPGQLPATGVNVGGSVQVLSLPSKDISAAKAGGQSPTVLVDSAVVYATAPDPSATGGWLVTLVVPKADAAAIAAASSAGLVALVQVS